MDCCADVDCSPPSHLPPARVEYDTDIDTQAVSAERGVVCADGKSGVLSVDSC